MRKQSNVHLSNSGAKRT